MAGMALVDGSDALRRYHEGTRHTPESVRRRARGLDFANQPALFKRYRGIAAEPLPAPRPQDVTMPTLDALARSSGLGGDGLLDRQALSTLLFLMAGVHPARGPRFRTYASAGALYPIEVYVITAGVDDLAPGVWHYDPLEHALRRLREGDLRAALAEATATPAVEHARVALALTGIPWRTAWKYEARGYRHLWWDAGMMLANLLAVADAMDVPCDIVVGFVDRDVDEFLGIDGAREFSLAVASLSSGARSPLAARIEQIHPAIEPYSHREERDPEIEGAHRAASFTSVGEVRAWQARLAERHEPPRVEPDVELPPLAPERASRDPTGTVILRRGSSRRLTRKPVPAEELTMLLTRSTAALSGDMTDGVLVPFVVANAVTGLPAGSYRFIPGRGFQRRREGELRAEAGFACLEQRLAADAATVLVLAADLDGVFAAFGARGYRVAQLQGGIMAGRFTLAAYAQCLGASGITFYDDVLAELVDAPGWSPMLAVVVGPEGARRSVQRCRDAVVSRLA